MSATYDSTLPSDQDWVRFLIGDKDVTRPILQDEEIAALLTEEANKYLAAARAGDLILARGHGAVSKSVDGLSISYGDSPESAYRGHLKTLKEKGCQMLLKKSGPSVLRML